MGIKTLTDKDAQFTLMAYNQMKQRMLMLNGVGLGDAEMKKCQLIKRLTNQGHNLQVMGVNCIREFLTSARTDEENARLQAERDLKEKDRILRRIMNTNVRFMGMGFRQAFQFMEADRAAEIALMAKQRGIMRRIVDSNVRLMSAGWNKLLEAHKARSGMLKEKLRFVIKALTDKDAMFTLMAYNQMKQRCLMLNGVGMGDAGMKKVQLIKRLTNSGYNLQVMGVNCIREFLTSARSDEERAREEYERQQAEKSRILRRIMNVNLRFMGMGFRQAFQFMETEREHERHMMFKQRGIMRRIIDTNARMISAGYNKLMEEYKKRQNGLKDRLKFVIKALTDKDANFTLMAYNGMKQRCLMLNGVGMGDAEMKKCSLIKRLTNQGHNLQVMGVNSIKEFLKSARADEEAARLEFERQQKEKDRILRRIMDANTRFMGMGFRQAWQFMEAEIKKERDLAAKQRGILRKMSDSTYRLLGAALNQLKFNSNYSNILIKKTMLKMTDSAYAMQAAAFRIFMHNHREANKNKDKSDKSSDELRLRKEGILKRMIDVEFRLMGMGLNRLIQQSKAIENLKRSFCLRILDKNVQLMAAAQRNLRTHAYNANKAEMSLKNKQEGIINRMMNANLRMMGGVLRYLKHINDTEKSSEAFTARMKQAVLHRIMNAGARWMSMAWRNGIEWTRFEVAREEKEMRLKKKVCMTLADKSFALCCAAMNNLKQWKNLGDLDDEKEKMLGDFRGGLLDGMAKTKEKFNREMQRIAIQKMRNANDKIKRMTKSIVLFANKGGERQMRAGLNKLIENKRERDAYFNEYKPRMTKIMMKFMRESATFMLSAGFKGMVENKRNFDGLMAKRTKLCKMLEGVIMKSDSLAKRYHLHL